MDSLCNLLEDSKAPDADSIMCVQEQEHGLEKQNQGDDEPDYSVVLTAVVDQCETCGKTFRKAGALQTHIDAQHKGIKYTCEICGSSMKYKGSLSVHMIQIHNIKTYQHKKPQIKRKCDKCKIKFSSNQLLYDHLREVHNESNPVSCSACSETFPNTYTYGAHKYKHAHLVPYRCDVCRLRYATKSGLRAHIESSEHQQKSADWPCHTEFDDEDFVCYICNNKHTYLSQHLSEHNNTDKQTNNENKYVKCHVCEETVTRYRLESHLMTQHGVITPPDAEKVEKNGKPRVKLTFKCSECDKTYKNREYFKLHMKSHSGEPKTQCDQCKYATYSASDMRKHKQSVHAGEKPYKCPTCNKAFADQSQRKRCMVRHTGIKSFFCRLCKESFSNGCARRKHEQRMCPLRQNTLPLYECKECNKSYESRTGLGHHMKKHKGEPEKCEQCDFKTFCHTDMRKHKLEHGGEDVYKCPICSQGYLNQKSLQRHVRQHNGEPEKCDQCDFTTVYRPEMWKHRREHAGIHKCPECSKDYLDRDTLREHIKLHHPGTQTQGNLKTRKRRNRNTGGGIHKCPECSKGYVDRSSLWQHIKRQHPGTQPQGNLETSKRRTRNTGGAIHKCPECPRGYFDQSSLWQHIKSQHPGIQPHQDIKNLRSSNTKAELHRHEETQSEENMKDAKLNEICVVKFKTEPAEEDSSSIEVDTEEAEEAGSSTEVDTEDVDEACSSIEAVEQNDKDNNTKACDLSGKEKTEGPEKPQPAGQDGETATHLKNQVVTNCESLKLEVEDCSDVEARDKLTTHEKVSLSIFNGDLDRLPVSQLKTIRSQLERNLDRIDKVLHNKESTPNVPSMIPAQSPLDNMDARMDVASGMPVVFL